MEIPLKRKLFYFFPVLFCFCLPFGSQLLSLIIVSWTIVSFFNIQGDHFKKGIRKPALQLSVLFFILTVVSSVLSENGPEGLAAIEVKMCFILFPYLLFCFDLPVAILKRCVVSFVSGCFFACLYLIIRAFLYTVNGGEGYFFYTMFSDLIHVSYFAMYLLVAITFIVVLYDKWFADHRRVMISSYFFLAVFVTTIFLCSSKMGLICLFVSVPLLVLYRARARFDLKIVAGLFVSMLMLGFIAYNIFPASFERLNALKGLTSGTIDKSSAESTAVRVLIWEQCIELIRHNFISGTGVGDANDELYNAYRSNGLTGAYEHRLNAHNQYFQTFIGMGIAGFVVLLLITLGQMISGFLRKNFLLFIFSFIVVMNFTVESMLQTSAGVLFFSFFFCFLNLAGEKELASDNALL